MEDRPHTRRSASWRGGSVAGVAVAALFVGSSVAAEVNEPRGGTEHTVEVDLSGCLSRSNGDYEITMDVTNFGPGDVIVAAPALAAGTTRWEAAQVTVPSSGRRHLTVKGTSEPGDEDVPDSWSGGRLLVDGQPYVIAETGDHWCG